MLEMCSEASIVHIYRARLLACRRELRSSGEEVCECRIYANGLPCPASKTQA